MVLQIHNSDEGWRNNVSVKDLTSEAMMDATGVLHVTPNPTKSAGGAVKCQMELFFSPRNYWWCSVNVAFLNSHNTVKILQEMKFSSDPS